MKDHIHPQFVDGITFVSPAGIRVFVADAKAVNDMTARRKDFIKSKEMLEISIQMSIQLRVQHNSFIEYLPHPNSMSVTARSYDMGYFAMPDRYWTPGLQC